LSKNCIEIFSEEIASGRLQVIASDIRNISKQTIGLEAQKYILAANIPYYITGELLRTFLETDTEPRTIAFLIQKEVADRILSKKESILSISVKVYGVRASPRKYQKGILIRHRVWIRRYSSLKIFQKRILQKFPKPSSSK
jgi:16S rRNA A1518/A1519 N6-dimethyltransferase RsmA/KsgA/DIM1 with predicted DNA glycosylase/AP lyase activity